MTITNFPSTLSRYPQIGPLIRALRRQAEAGQGISQLCLAARIGCSESTIRNLERGRIDHNRMAVAYRKALVKLYPDLKQYFIR